ncbi:hypothetical protein BC938DRAFT_480600 [Jimgerdemannia flammicorona]|uniref:Brr2 N-terminal helicase PWI domain-containing protein n=1 Tax=Jimgerdemannia flammicorona TaxID=994334 RepID=A0A433QXG9_9FUNG|nr:hypothetical protein BC938DRAFT_480600 [Jimgerdemannia flammicorona]
MVENILKHIPIQQHLNKEYGYNSVLTATEASTTAHGPRSPARHMRSAARPTTSSRYSRPTPSRIWTRSSLSSPVAMERFARLVNLGKKITDYKAAPAPGMDVDQNGDRIGEIDDVLGVAVCSMGTRARTSTRIPHRTSWRTNRIERQAVSVWRCRGHGTRKVDSSTRRTSPRTTLMPSGCSAYYPDPHTTQEKTAATIRILEFDGIDICYCEDELKGLLDYDKFELVKILTRHREIIVWERDLLDSQGSGWRAREAWGGNGTRGVIENAMEIADPQQQRGASRKIPLPVKANLASGTTGSPT